MTWAEGEPQGLLNSVIITGLTECICQQVHADAHQLHTRRDTQSPLPLLGNQAKPHPHKPHSAASNPAQSSPTQPSQTSQTQTQMTPFQTESNQIKSSHLSQIASPLGNFSLAGGIALFDVKRPGFECGVILCLPVGCSYHALVEFSVLRGAGRVKSRVRTLNLRKANFWLFRVLVHGIPWETALGDKGVWWVNPG